MTGAPGQRPPGQEQVVVAVLTYRRPQDLRVLLPVLLEQVSAVGPRARVLVVDNDPDAGARGVVGPGVNYVHEPEPGIAAARNRALDEAAAAGDDLLVFLDDDERPQPGWLESLLATYAVGRPAAVVGPVVSQYERPPEPWIEAGQFFRRRRLPTGTRVEVAATNNLLLDLAQLDATGIRFDERFGLSGGSDTLFTRQLSRAGRRLVWCDEAVVLDVVPAARLTRRWVLRRAYRSGNSWSRTSVELEGSRMARARTRLSCSLRGLARMGGGAARWGAGAGLRSRAHRAAGLRTLMRGAGMVAGAWGSVYAEYRRLV